MTRRVLMMVTIAALLAVATVFVYADNTEDPLDGLGQIAEQIQNGVTTDNTDETDTEGTATQRPVGSSNATEVTTPDETNDPVTTEAADTTKAPVITEPSNTTEADDTTKATETTAPVKTTVATETTTAPKVTTTQPPETTTKDNNDNDAQKPSATSGRVTTEPATTESETETETETESATEESTDNSDADGGEKKKGFASPLEAVAFYMGVPVIISVFAVAAAIFRRVIYSDNK